MRRSSLRWTIPTFLALQLGLLWIQGAQLHRQNQVLQGLREDIQALSESIEDQSAASSAAVPAAFQASPAGGKKSADEEQDPAAKELQASRDSAQKAVKEAREVQSKLSITENIRKAEEAQKIQAATTSWQKWVWGGLLLVVLALGARAAFRGRG